MTQHVLILGGTGRFGRHATRAFKAAGWHVTQFNRKTDDMTKTAMGMDVIVNAMNPSYELWAAEVPKLTAQVIAAARASGATVIIPGNVYVYGKDAPERFAPETPHRAANPLGRIRIKMEAAYKAAKVQTIVLRAGDYIDTEASGTWFDRFIIAKLAKGIFTYPGPMNIRHAWAYLPDVAHIAVALAERRSTFAAFEDVTFAGYTLTGEELANALEKVSGRNLTHRRFSYLPLQMLAPFWRLMRHVVEMRYLWNKPHFLDSKRVQELVPEFQPTPLQDALKTAL